MSKGTAIARLVDGGTLDLEFSDEMIAKLKALRAEGYTGKRLIQLLYTDDWGPPPIVVEIRGTTSTGEIVDTRIPYS